MHSHTYVVATCCKTCDEIDIDPYDLFRTTDAGFEERILDAENAAKERADWDDEHDFELAVGADDVHAVYAVLDTDLGLHKVRVSDPLDYREAIDAHTGLHHDPSEHYDRPVSYPGYTVYGRRVRYFAVRSVTDPDWPTLRTAKLNIRDDRTGKTYTLADPIRESLTNYILGVFL